MLFVMCLQSHHDLKRNITRTNRFKPRTTASLQQLKNNGK